MRETSYLIFLEGIADGLHGRLDGVVDLVSFQGINISLQSRRCLGKFGRRLQRSLDRNNRS